MFEAASNNRGAENRYWHAQAEPTTRFAWDEPFSSLTDFTGTPGDENALYLADAQRNSLLVEAGIPQAAEPH
jgi:hypothetical protein